MMTNITIRYNDIDWDLKGQFSSRNDPERGYPATFLAESIKVGRVELYDYLTRNTVEILEERAAEALSDSSCCRWEDERI